MDRGSPLLDGSELECAAPRISVHEPTPDAAAMALQRSHGLSNTPLGATSSVASRVPLGASEMAPAGGRMEGTDPIKDAISLSICVYYGHLAFS